MYLNKYIKYKKKYLKLKQRSGSNPDNIRSTFSLYDETTNNCNDASKYVTIVNEFPINELNIYQIKLNFVDNYNKILDERSKINIDNIKLFDITKNISILKSSNNFLNDDTYLNENTKYCFRFDEIKTSDLENVKMKKEYQDIITEHLGVEPIEINSNLVSAQNRKRIYWTNIPNITQPNDKYILLKDIVHEHNDEVLNIELPNFNVNPSSNGMNGDVYSIEKNKSRTLTTNKGEGQKISIAITKYIVPFDETLQILDKEVQRGKVGYFRKDSQANRVYYTNDKAITLTGEAGGGAAKMGQYLFGSITPYSVDKSHNTSKFNSGRKFYTLTTQGENGVLVEGYIRKLTPIECERLQTVPDNYSDCVSDSQRYKMLGNGWTVDVIAHIFKNLKF